jgi:hypothetical protein
MFISETDALRFADAPAEFFGDSRRAMHQIDPARLAELQLSALRLRFDALRDRVPVLTAMAEEQGVTAIEQLDDIVPLLFQHSVYKSYPASLLERSRFGALTRWLDRLTSLDLAGVDADRCDSIDAWLDCLDAETDLRVVHSSGTTGNLSLLPRSVIEWRQLARAARPGLYQFTDPEDERDHSGELFHIVWPTFRTGRTHITRLADYAFEVLAGGRNERFHALNPGHLSADAMFVAGLIQRAALRGEQPPELNPSLAARREEFLEAQRHLGADLSSLFDQLASDLHGERIWICGTWHLLYPVATQGLNRGLVNAFGPNTTVTAGGGAKGHVMPDDWEQVVRRFIGVPNIQHVYGMTEITAMHKLCANGRYHFEPWIIPFVLDPDDGRPLPRNGTHTGRAAILDLMASTYWGGFITGDEVTIDWTPCACGQTTTHIARRIERYSEQQGGDDKITCLASENAHRAALDLLGEQLG